MISAKIGEEYKYDITAEKYRLAFEFLKRKDFASLPVGSIDLGYGVKANIQIYNSFDWDANFFETHEKFVDVQYVVEGVEYCGICKRDALVVSKPYDAVSDVTFYKDPENYGKVLLNSGDFIVLFPEDAHKPRCAVKENIPIKKVVVKVPV